jgi:hypothetical protein
LFAEMAISGFGYRDARFGAVQVAGRSCHHRHREASQQNPGAGLARLGYSTRDCRREHLAIGAEPKDAAKQIAGFVAFCSAARWSAVSHGGFSLTVRSDPVQGSPKVSHDKLPAQSTSSGQRKSH